MNEPKTKKNNPADLALPIMYRTAPCGHSGDVFRLKLELIGSDEKSLPPEDWKILHKYGGAEKSISREILVSRHSTLRALHFMIQMLFGWQHSHLHEFEFCDEDFLRLLSHDNTPALNYLSTCGVYFRFPIVDFDDDDWDDDYEEGMSGKTWMKSKYKKLRDFPGVSEEWKENQRKISDFREWLKGKYGVAEDGTERIYIRPDFYEEFLAKEKGEKLEGKMISLKECTVDELLRTVRGVEAPNPSALREHLHLAEVLATGVTALADENGQYLPKVSEYFYGPMRTEVGIEKDSDLESTWALIEVESDEGLEDAESYRRDVLAFQKLMRDNEERGRHKDDNWQPEGFREALYKWQRHFMDSPFNPSMDQYYIPPIATTLYYHYDFGDSWRVRITVEDVYSLEENWEDSSVLADGGEPVDICAPDERTVKSIKSRLPKGEDALWFGKDRKYIDGEMYAQVLSVYRSGGPLCIAKDGLDVLDDVGGVGGYIRFLQELHEADKETRAENREWARGQGWTGRDRKPEKML